MDIGCGTVFKSAPGLVSESACAAFCRIIRALLVFSVEKRPFDSSWSFTLSMTCRTRWCHFTLPCRSFRVPADVLMIPDPLWTRLKSAARVPHVPFKQKTIVNSSIKRFYKSQKVGTVLEKSYVYIMLIKK